MKETIQLGHGSGGKLTRELLDELVYTAFDNPLLGQRHDGAIFDLSGPLAYSTDSFVVSPIFFKGGSIGELAVNGTVNDLAMCGAVPRYISLALIIEEGLEKESLRRIIQDISEACKRAGVEVVTGDTKIVEKGKGDKIFINTTGIGTVHPAADIGIHRVGTGDSIIINAPLAQHGMAIMSEREGLKFESEIVSDTTNLNKTVKKLLDRYGNRIHLLRDATRGGLAAVLSEISIDASVGVFIQEKQIPIEKQVQAACEILGLDPLYVANEGVFTAIVDSAIAADMVNMMKEDENMGSSVIIGEITEDRRGQVIMESLIGGRRIVTPLIGEQLPRIC